MERTFAVFYDTITHTDTLGSYCPVVGDAKLNVLVFSGKGQGRLTPRKTDDNYFAKPTSEHFPPHLAQILLTKASGPWLQTT